MDVASYLRIGAGPCLGLVLALAACTADEPHVAREAPDTTLPLGEASAARAEPGAVRLADRLGETARELHEHARAMRVVPPPQAGEAMEEHVRVLDDALRMMEQQVRAGGNDALQGATGERHRVVRDEIRTLRAEAEELRGASEDEVRARLPGHLDRLDRVAETMENMAAEVRRGA